MTGSSQAPGDASGTGRFWGLSDSGVRVVSRPIAIDGLARDRLLIEIPPRRRVVEGREVDASREAVDAMASALAAGLALRQLVLAAVALRFHLRLGRARLERVRHMRERWADLARRARRNEEGEELRVAWERLEAEERELDGPGAAGPGKDLRHPFLLNLERSRADPGRPRERSAASAMQTLVDALAETLSRTDLAILEIALRRGIRAHAPQVAADRWEHGLLIGAEAEFAAQFAWVEPFRSGGPASGSLPRMASER